MQELSINNPLSEDIDFHDLPLYTRVRALHRLCEFRLDVDGVSSLLSSLNGASLRVDPLGEDASGATYWYFYGTRLYREGRPEKVLNDKKPNTCITKNPWQLVCQTEEDWQRLIERFKNSRNQQEKDLHRLLVEDYLTEIQILFKKQEQLIRRQ